MSSAMAATQLLLPDEDVEIGGKEERSGEGGIQNDFAYNNNVNNAHIRIRMGITMKNSIVINAVAFFF